MPDLYEVLERIRKQPAMYIGSASLRDLHMYLVGYQNARLDFGMPITEQEKEFSEFKFWIQNRYRIYSAVSWSKIIMLYSSSEEQAFDRFFELFDQFLQRSHKTEGYEAKRFWEHSFDEEADDEEES